MTKRRPQEKEETVCREFSAHRVSRLRRAVFAYSTTFVCIGGTLGITLAGYESTMAQRVSEALMSYAELMAMLYLGASVIDRTQVVDRITGHWTPPTKQQQLDGDER